MSHISPYPAQGGECLRAAGLIQALTKFAHVSAVLQSPLPDSSQSNVDLFAFDFLSEMKPLMRYHKYHDKLITLLESIIAKNPVDLVFIDYQFYGQYIDWFQQKGISVIYGTHNAESDLTLQEIKQVNSWGQKLKKLLLFYVQRWHENHYFGHADAFVVVSKNDADYYQHAVDSQKTWVIPNFIDPQSYQLESNPTVDTRCLVMTANFHNFQNAEGIGWFLKEVWQKFHLHENYHLLLVGVGSEEIAKQYIDVPHVSATGCVESISPYLQKAWAAIVPLHYGSGSRLKILEAIQHQTPVISTTLGAEGLEMIDGEHVLIADAPEKFFEQLEVLKDVERRQSMIDAANRLFHKRYSLPACTHLLGKIIERLRDKVD